MEKFLSILLVLILVVLLFVGVFQGTISDSIVNKSEEVENVINGSK